jgi:hypothetical protein
MDRPGDLYPAICRNQRYDCFIDPDVGSNRVYPDLQKSKKIAFLLTKIRKTSEIFS